MSARELGWYRLLLGWLEANLRQTTSERLGLRSTPLKLVRFPDSPGPGMCTWTTFEHSDLRWPGPGVEVGYELVFSSRAEVDGLTVLRRAVESLGAMQRPAQPGLVLLDLLVAVDGLSPLLRHAVLLPPWIWDHWEPLVEGERRVEAVQVVPATEAEVDLARREGVAALAEHWERALAQLLEPGRPSTL
ncbi:MAG: suppressor of fused domain protein [Alphaproteobacteria bacterium]|nr:suppressor of fused domain protein [Alphaproteobacteria bacterium]